MKNAGFYKALSNVSDIFDKINLEEKYLIKLAFGERDKNTNWSYIGEAITDYAFSRAFIQHDVTSMMYLDTFDKGYSIASLSLLFVSFDADMPFDELIGYYNSVANDNIVVNGNGPWCIWDEEEITFYDNLESAIKDWIGHSTSFAIEPSPASARVIIKETSYDKMEKLAKEISSPQRNPFETARMFAEMAYRMK